jgi:glyoxylase-like metal-dependent hydrolase (beta-lactamase superfamily II)
MIGMTLRIADRWFDYRHVDDDITWLWEPHVLNYTRCNIWHIRGRDRDLLVDTGYGIGSLQDEVGHLFQRPIAAIATHTHYDHIGGHHEFADCRMHAAETAWFKPTGDVINLNAEVMFGLSGVEKLRAAGYDVPLGPIISALPRAGFDLACCPAHTPPQPSLIEDGDVIDLGNRQFEVLHLPGHSPGGIGLWEAVTGTLFSGDTVYDGPLLDAFEDANIADYIASMKRLRDLPVRIVHGGHEPSFGRDRLVAIIDDYLRLRDR